MLVRPRSRKLYDRLRGKLVTVVAILSDNVHDTADLLTKYDTDSGFDRSPK